MTDVKADIHNISLTLVAMEGRLANLEANTVGLPTIKEQLTEFKYQLREATQIQEALDRRLKALETEREDELKEARKSARWGGAGAGTVAATGTTGLAILLSKLLGLFGSGG